MGMNHLRDFGQLRWCHSLEAPGKEILASAIKACAVFVGSGVVKDVTRMGRILKLLTSALDQCQGMLLSLRL